MSTGEPELELTRVSFYVPDAPSGAPRTVSDDLAQAHLVQLEDRTLELDLRPVGADDARCGSTPQRRHYWEEAKALLEGQLPHADKLWRVALFAEHGAMALSRIGGYLGEGDPPVKDVWLDSVLPNRLLAALAGPSARPSSGAARAEFRIQAWEAHLDTAVEAAKGRLAPMYPWLPLSVHGECSSYFLEPLPLDWIHELQVPELPMGLKAAYLVDPERGTTLRGAAYAQDLRPLAAFWRNTSALGERAGVGKASCVYLLGAQNLVVMEPTREGNGLLITVWYKTTSVPQLLLASRRCLRALESRQGPSPHAGPARRDAGGPPEAWPGEAAPGASYVGILDFKKSLLDSLAELSAP